MELQSYFIVNQATNTVENTVVWDGDVSKWAPPDGCFALADDTTPAKVWVLNEDNTDWVLGIELGAGDIGFIWDGQNLITNRPKPDAPVQPITSGTQEL